MPTLRIKVDTVAGAAPVVEGTVRINLRGSQYRATTEATRPLNNPAIDTLEAVFRLKHPRNLPK